MKSVILGDENKSERNSIMKSGFLLGRFFGIEIRIDWSLMLIFFLITWNLASGFGSIHQNWSLVLRWGTAIAAAVVFFASVLAHELAHSLVARSQGVPVRSITLFLFGGVSNIQREPPNPTSEFLLTIVGPLTSIVLGILFIFIAGVPLQTLLSSSSTNLNYISQLGPLPTLLLWLGPVNVVLGLFNLVPGFPLDGGRLVRSILWAITDNLRKATRWASYLGQLIAWLMIAAGFAMIFGFQIPLLGSGIISGLWLAFIGWFLHSAAVRSYEQILLQDILEDVPVTSIMRDDAPTVAKDISISTLVHDHIMKSDDHAFPVLDGETLVGMVTLDDVRGVSRDMWDSKTVADIMTPKEKIVAVSAKDDVADALTKLQEQDIRQLPVIEGTHMLGLLRRRDIIRWLQLHNTAAKL
jgi:Zn-dependent protease/CBS domain-containing protein